MKVMSVEKQEKSKVALTVAVERAEWDKALDEVFRQNRQRINVPGFRRGKAPRKVVETVYGKGVFYEQAVNETYPEAYDKAIEEEGLEPVEQPAIDVEEMGEEGYTFVATFHVIPEIEIGEYKGLTAYKPPVVVEDAEIDAEIDKLRERNSRLVTAERPAQMGDTVILDYQGLHNGHPFEGGKGEEYSLTLGSGRFIPGFEDKLVGCSAGDTPHLELTFPEEYHAEHLAGQPVVFRCKIHEIKEKFIPDADDDFAQDISEFDTMDEYKASLREKMTESRQKDAEHAFEDNLVDKIIETLQGDIPEPMIAYQMQNLLDDLRYNMSRQGISMDMYMQMSGQTPQGIQEQYRPIAERQVKAGLIFDKIADLEGFEATPEEIEEEYNRLAGVYTMNLDQVKESVSEKTVVQDIKARKAAELVKETGIETDVPPVTEAEEKESVSE